jgi:PAS domain S-box-containing protein/diguanylate cyclase (GGDEF)-like protein
MSSPDATLRQKLPSDIYHAVFEHAPTPLAIMEEDGTISLANMQFSKETGYPKEEIEGKMTWEMFVVPEQPEISEGRRRGHDVQEGAVLMPGTCRLKRRDGTIMHGMFRTRAIPETDKTICSGIDVTALRHGGKEPEENGRHFQAAFEASPIGVAIVSLEGRWLHVNPAFCNSLGYAEAELLTKTFQDITHPEDIENDLEHQKRLIDDQIPYYQIEKRYIHRDGYTVWAALHVSIARDSRGYPLYFIGQMEDITERKWLEQKMQTALITDELTGLYNKRGFLEHGLERLKPASGRAKVSTLFLVSLDGMKEVNEAAGQKRGDAMIKEMGQMLLEAFRTDGVVGRTGGVEFSVLVEDATHAEAVRIDDCVARFERAHREDPSIRVKVRTARCLRSDDLFPELQHM